MKKLGYIVLVPLGLIVLILGILYTSKKEEVSKTPSECAALTKEQLSSERALGLVVENRSMLAVLLSGEKNYSPPGGHVEFGETYPQALQREFKEEVGLSVDQANMTPFKVTCEPRYDSIERTDYYLVSRAAGSVSLESKDDRIKWVGYDYHTNKRADTELKSALLFLKEGNLID